MKKQSTTSKGGKYASVVWKAVRREVIGGLVATVAVKAFMMIRYGLEVTLNSAGLYDWGFAVLLGIVIGWKLSKTSIALHKQVIFFASITGLYFGIGVAVVDIVLYRNAWAAWNLLLRPVLFIMIIAATAVMVFTLKWSNSKNKA